MNILHVHDIANVAARLAEAQRTLSHTATVLRLARGPLAWNLTALGRWSRFGEADILHVHGGIWRSQVALGLYRRIFRDQAVVVHLHGSETRTGLGLHHLGWADEVVCSTPDLRRYVPSARWIPNPVRLPIDPAYPSRGERVVLGHFPTSRELKGTVHVLRAFRGLRSDSLKVLQSENEKRYIGGDMELRVTTGLSPIQTQDAMRDCDIVIDQINDLGVYGMVSAEAMAQGKVVVCSYDPHYYEDPPLIRAMPNDLPEVLQDLLARRAEWREIGEGGRSYVERVHEARAVAGRFLRLYYDLLNKGRWDTGRAVRYWKKRGMGYIDEFRDGRMAPEPYRRQEEALGRVLSRLDYASFLEVGCGFGRIARHLNRPEVRGMGIDLSMDQLRALQEYVGHGVLDLASGDARSLPLEDGAADLVVAVEVLMHLPPEPMRQALAEMTRVSRKYVLNVDWYEEIVMGAQLKYSWIHDYPTVYDDLGLSVESFPTHERSRQRIFLATKRKGDT